MGDGKKLKEILDSKGTNVRQIAKHKSHVKLYSCKFRFIGSPIPLATDQCFRL